MNKITIRPSSIDGFTQCPQQWYRIHILGENSIPNSRAAIGTAIHSGVETLWNESIAAKDKVVNKTAMEDAAMDALEKENQKGLQYDDGEDANSAQKEIRTGLGTFVTDIVPDTDIPTAVETRYSVDIDGHPIVARVSGTLDYINTATGFVADVKTGKRKHSVANSGTQQSIYQFLAEENGVDVKGAVIQNVILKQKPQGLVMNSAIDIPKAKAAVNNMLDVLDVYHQDVVDPNMLFRGNPKYFLCSEKYCAFFNDCKWTGH